MVLLRPAAEHLRVPEDQDRGPGRPRLPPRALRPRQPETGAGAEARSPSEGLNWRLQSSLCLTSALGDRNDDFSNLDGMSAEVAELQAEVRKLTEIVRSLLKTVAELQAAKI